MGRLLNKLNIDLTPRWYFADVNWDTFKDTHYYPFPNSNFPHCLAINIVSVNDVLKSTIRKFVNRQLLGDVILHEIDASYRVYTTPDKEWDRSYTVSLKYHGFYFEEEDDAVAFKLRFSDLITDVDDRKK